MEQEKAVLQRASTAASTNALRELWADLRQHDSIVWRRAMHAGVVHGPEALVRYAPPLFGALFAAILPKQRRFVAETLRLALGERGPFTELVDVARVFMTYASSLAEAFVASIPGAAPLRSRCDDDEHFSAAVAEGRGVVIATAHTGGWQHAGQILRGRHDAEVIVVMRRERDARAQALQDSVRDRTGIRLMHVGGDPRDALTLLGHLRRGGIVAVQVDRLPRGMRGQEVQLFGRPWSMPEGPLQLAAVSGAPILPVFTSRRGFMDYQVHIAPPIHVPRRPSAADLDEAGQLLARALEAFVRAHPTQWFHFDSE
jgi:phosphatidylinositol dimannoside acyltransferase